MKIECIIMNVIKVDEITTLLWLQPQVENSPPIPFPVHGPQRAFNVGEHYWLDFGRFCSEYNVLVYIAQQSMHKEALC